LKLNYKTYWRKTGLKGKWGNIYLERIFFHKPKNFLEIGVFCGVTARNTCDFLKKINGDSFNYIGIDLFGGDKNTSTDEIEPKFLLNQKFSNPLKNIYYNLLLRENLNSISSVKKFLDKYKNNIKLIAGDTNSVLASIDLNKIDFIFLDGGHSYETVTNDLEILYKSLNGKKAVVLCDDYGDESYIKEVRNAIDDFVKKNNLRFELIENRFAELIL
jgi:hypothetical protein